MIPVGVLGSAVVPPAAWTPASLANLKGWWDADDASTFTYSSGVVVSEWRDKSGLGRHLVQATTSKQPSRNGSVNSRTSVVFDGTDDNIKTASGYTNAKPATLMLVARSTAASGQRTALIGARTAEDGRIFRTTGGTIDIYQGAFLSSGASWGTTAAHSVVGVFNGTSSKIAVDSGTWTTGTAGAASFGDGGMWLGSYHNGASDFWQGDICEAVHVEASISDADRNAWFAYCSTKWGTP